MRRRGIKQGDSHGNNHRNLSRRHKGTALLLTTLFGVLTVFGGSTLPSYADDPSSEAGSTEEEVQDASPNIMESKNGCIVFWEWEKVTTGNYKEMLKYSPGSEYKASMFVFLDASGNPKGFLSTYADEDHIKLLQDNHVLANTFETYNVQQSAPIYNQMDQSAVDGSAVSKTKKLSYFVDGTRNAFILQDEEGFSLNDHPEYFNQDRFFTSGNCKGVFWVRDLVQSDEYQEEKAGGVVNQKDYQSGELQMFQYYTGEKVKGYSIVDVVGRAIVGNNIYGDYKTKTEKISSWTMIPVDIALSRASAKSNPTDQFYHSIGQKLNGNIDYYFGMPSITTEVSTTLAYSGQEELFRTYHMGASGNLVASDDTRSVMAGGIMYNVKWQNKPNSASSEVSSRVTLVPYKNEYGDRWVIMGTAFGRGGPQLAYVDGYIQTLTSDYFVRHTQVDERYGNVFCDLEKFNSIPESVPEGTVMLAYQKKIDKNHYEVFCSLYKKENFFNLYGANQTSKNVYNTFKWYIGTPHMFAALSGTGADPATGAGGTITIPSGSTYIVKDSSFTDTDGNPAQSDGVVLPEGSTIVIEDGGVLSVEGNFINNGRIINRGGTIVVKDGATISPYMNTSEGTIECCQSPKTGRSGDMIIMPGAKVFCLVDSGTYQKKEADPALLLTGGGTVINYGTLVTGYVVMDSASRIENRKDAIYYAGHNRTGPTVMLHNSKINKSGIVGIQAIPAQYYTSDLTEPNGYHTGVKGMNVKVAGGTRRLFPGTIINESTVTFVHTSGSVDYAQSGQVNIKTPEY